MDGIAVWLLFLVFLPFLLFFWKMLLMAWKSFLFTKTIKNLSDEMEIITEGYAAYGCFLGVLLLVLFALIIKMALKRKKIQSRNAALRQTIARQNQLSTVSRSVDTNSNYSNDGANNARRGSDATLKIDLPPTYEEVMKNFAEARERAATSVTSTGSGGTIETIDTHGIVAVEIVTIPTSEQRSVV